MDGDADTDFFYIAKEGLKAPLPPPWKPCRTADNEIFYFNFSNGESVWDHPCDEFYKTQYLEAKKAREESKKLPTVPVALQRCNALQKKLKAAEVEAKAA